MTDYKKLAAYYLKANKTVCDHDHRCNDHSNRVVCGTEHFLFLYAAAAKDVRKEADYEIVFLTDDQETLSQIASDDRVT